MKNDMLWAKRMIFSHVVDAGDQQAGPPLMLDAFKPKAMKSSARDAIAFLPFASARNYDPNFEYAREVARAMERGRNHVGELFNIP